MSRFIYTRPMHDFLKAGYREMGIPKLCDAFNIKFGLNKSRTAIKRFICNHKYRCGRTGRWEKGHESWNKSTKGLTGRNVTSFTKGDIPGNTKPMWSERICTKDGYILMKVPEHNPYTGAATRYKHKHLWLWEQEHGPVPEGHIVRFIDGDKANCVPGNLELITQSLNVRLNQLQHSAAPAELQPSIQTIAKLQIKNSERSMELQG